MTVLLTTLLGARVFVSYSHKDTFVVAYISRLLGRAFIEAVIDTDYVAGGMNVRERLETLIRDCHVVVFVASSPSVRSNWCRWERDIAVRHHIPILPVKLNGSVRIPTELGDLNWLDLSHEELTDAVARVIGSIYVLRLQAAA